MILSRLPAPTCTSPIRRAIALALLAAAPAVALAAPDIAPPAADSDLQEVLVFGRAERLIGIASAASEGTVGGADLTVRPLLRVAELLEVVPGLIAAQHSGSGKANQYFLRGFNLDHGTDFTTLLDDVPLNLSSHGHGQGYLDVNGIIPEVIDRIDYRKGPYRADLGDFALAGAALMRTLDQFPAPFVAVEGGQYGWKRVAAGNSQSLGSGELLLIGQWKAYDGPWQRPENLNHYSGFGKYSQPTALGQLHLSLSAYSATWNPTEQVPERAIGTAVCADAFCTLDPSATGQTARYIATARLLGDNWKAMVYSQFYDWNMYSNPTYDYQIHQSDRRFTEGGRFERHGSLGEALTWSAGIEGRFDQISRLQVDHTEQRRFLDYVSTHQANEASMAAYGELTWLPTNSLRLTAGLRGDSYHFSTTAKDPAFLDGSATAQLASPKLGAAWTLLPQVELYANWGRGFHSNDSRGITATDPPIPGLIVGTGKELGARFQHGGFTLTGAYWWLDVGSELHFVGDSNSVEPGEASKRHGYELVGFWRPVEWLAIDGVWTVSNARYAVASPEDHITGAFENAGSLGASIIKGPWEIGMRLRHLGPYPLLEDNSQRTAAEDVLNLRTAWTHSHLTVYAELLNVFNSDGKDMVYWYETQVAGLDKAPVEGRVSRSEEPRTFRFGVKYSF